MSNVKKKKMSELDRKVAFGNLRDFALTLGKIAILTGVGYVILSPLIGMFVNSIASTKDIYNPMMFILPADPGLDKYRLVIERMDYFRTIGADLIYTITLTLLQLLVCSMVGYGFARFNFKGKNILFACVVVMIVIPPHTVMLPLYMTFKNFNLLGLVTLIHGSPVNLMSTVAPMYLMTALGCGVRSGLYIYIFNQFFRGLPKEIEEAAFVDGAGVWYTYFRIMLVNAMPSVITVTVFSLVWQFNDVFYANLFLISENVVISKKISSLAGVIANQDKILNVTIQEQYVDAGILLILLPIILLYLLLQKQFIEGAERSGIVG
ncbi:MAG: carbohydrate ABC transporter permease [Lachnospiraceae bacterium]|nr:carbohydrate ABC transporter permease [Lachnospiraceae bacterium]